MFSFSYTPIAGGAVTVWAFISSLIALIVLIYYVSTRRPAETTLANAAYPDRAEYRYKKRLQVGSLLWLLWVPFFLSTPSGRTIILHPQWTLPLRPPALQHFYDLGERFRKLENGANSRTTGMQNGKFLGLSHLPKRASLESTIGQLAAEGASAMNQTRLLLSSCAVRKQRFDFQSEATWRAIFFHGPISEREWRRGCRRGQKGLQCNFERHLSSAPAKLHKLINFDLMPFLRELEANLLVLENNNCANLRSSSLDFADAFGRNFQPMIAFAKNSQSRFTFFHEKRARKLNEWTRVFDYVVSLKPYTLPFLNPVGGGDGVDASCEELVRGYRYLVISKLEYVNVLQERLMEGVDLSVASEIMTGIWETFHYVCS